MVDFRRIRSLVRPVLRRYLGPWFEEDIVEACEFERVQAVGAFLRRRFGLPTIWDPPKAVGVVLGSGLGDWVDSLGGLIKVPFSEIPGFPHVSAEGHAGNFCFVRIKGVPIFIMQGRVHCYEGHPLSDVVLGVRVMAKSLGVTNLILTNAAGGIREGLAPGDLVFLSDHVNFIGSPLAGTNDSRLGTRFPDMSEPYHKGWREAAYGLARVITERVHNGGVYMAVPGPEYETPATVRFLRIVGGDLVGMSTAVEVIAARHAGIRYILGISCVTNLAAGLGNTELSHDEVKETANQAKPYFMQILTAIVTGNLP